MRLPGVRSYPKVISYDGEEYQIKFIRGFKDKLQIGECCSTDKIIRIKLGMSKEETFITFLHEILHLIEMEHPIDLKHSHVYKMSEALAQIFMENF